MFGCESCVKNADLTVGVVVPSFYNIFFAEVVRGIEDYFGYNMHSLILSRSQGTAEAEMHCIMDLLERNVFGIIVISPNMSGIDEKFYQEVIRQVPLVFINGYRKISGASYVNNDEAKGMEEALNYLFKLNHRKILFVRGINSDSYEIKEVTYRRIMKDKGLELEKYILNIGEGNSNETVDNTTRQLVEFLPTSDVTAIFCCNDLMGVGAINACKRLQLSIPKDISIVGFDNISISHFIEPHLTTVDQNMFYLGSNAAEVLVSNISSNKPKHVTLYNSIIERESTGLAPSENY